MIALNGHEIVPTMFPDRTSQVWKIPTEHFSHITNTVRWEFENEAEFLHIAQLKTLIDAKYIMSECILEIPYLPYARQDKDIANGATFALYAFARLLNALHFNTVICTDAHSSVSSELIERLTVSYHAIEIFKAQRAVKADLFCYPDAGALKKYNALLGAPYVYATKERDQATGDLSGCAVHGDVNGMCVLIVDDLCDGGGTFIALANTLNHRGALEVNLYVSHGLFTKTTQPLLEAGIKHIFTSKGQIV